MPAPANIIQAVFIWGTLLPPTTDTILLSLQGLPAVPKLKEGLNPATWMLQISTPGMEKVIGVDFAVAYKSSATYRYPSPLPQHTENHPGVVLEIALL
jgi:hypothetical protein